MNPFLCCLFYVLFHLLKICQVPRVIHFIATRTDTRIRLGAGMREMLLKIFGARASLIAIVLRCVTQLRFNESRVCCFPPVRNLRRLWESRRNGSPNTLQLRERVFRAPGEESNPPPSAGGCRNLGSVRAKNKAGNVQPP